MAEAQITLTPDELLLLSGAALYGLHCAGVVTPNTLLNLHKYIERARRTLEPDSAAAGVLKSLATKMRDTADLYGQSPTFKPEVFTI